ncbi:MAG TPA: translation initiation factor IF-2 N-terminal domain-containing protein, partial [Verrucomicrobiae bacterium]
MPVRVYDIAKKLGLENKQILAKAKELGITAAKVPSSSLDKISAEWLEEEIIKSTPEVAARLAAKSAPAPAEEKPKPPPVEEKVVVIHAPPPEPAPAPVEPPPAPVEIPAAPVVEAPV